MISGVILTKNEEKNIEECVKSVSFCQEILVIDDNSTDKTRDFAKRTKARIVIRSLNMDYAAACNFAMQAAKYNWVLFVDADERISTGLAKQIIKATQNTKCAAYKFKRNDFMWGKWLTHGEVGAFGAMRLVKKNSGKWVRRVHQYFKTTKNVGDINEPILHYPHKTLKRFIENVDRWSSWHAIANKEEGKRSTIFKICFYPIGHFIYNYVFRLGFLDGIQGLVFALVMASHSYLAWSKLWLMQKESIKAREGF